MLLSVDWDYFVGTGEHVFDSPFWGTPDRPFHRLERWRELALKRDPQAGGFEVLAGDFPLLADPGVLLEYRHVPVFSGLSHESAARWLELFPHETQVLNLDSHHDLYSGSGDPARLRPGNWAGLALRSGRIHRYACCYPQWHGQVRVTEGFDLERTQGEIAQHLEPRWLERIELHRGQLPLGLPVTSMLIVQSPAWTNPLYDERLHGILHQLEARPLSPTWVRNWPNQTGTT